MQRRSAQGLWSRILGFAGQVGMMHATPPKTEKQGSFRACLGFGVSGIGLRERARESERERERRKTVGEREREREA